MSNIDQELQTLIVESSQLLMEAQTEEAVKLLESRYSNYSENSLYLQSLGESYLENSDLDKAYTVLTTACELDSEGKESVEKFLYLGQIIGNEDGIKYLSIGVEKLLEFHELISKQDSNGFQSLLQNEGSLDTSLRLLLIAYNTKDKILSYILKKLNQGIFAIIEIWMTDLCMEPNAEEECNKLINLSLNLDGSNAETWSLLASIRISQSLNEEGKEAICKSWDLFNEKKTKLEELANGGSNDSSIDINEVNLEYIELIQPLSTLCKYAIELGLFEKSILISTAIQDINEQNLESYYLEGFANYLIAKRLQNNVSLADSYQISQNFMEYPISLKTNDESNVYIQESREALSQAYKLSQVDSIVADTDPELIETVNELLNQVGGFLLKSKKDNEINEDNWENEVPMDE